MRPDPISPELVSLLTTIAFGLVLAVSIVMRVKAGMIDREFHALAKDVERTINKTEERISTLEHCRACGSKYRQGAKFCALCGTIRKRGGPHA